MAQRNSKLTAEIAEQTFKDALSMRTIALVTLLFLPGTYISVSFANSLIRGSKTLAYLAPGRLFSVWPFSRIGLTIIYFFGCISPRLFL
jgi:hypothetical protein